METTPFLTVDDEKISLPEALKYLRYTGGFQKFLADILRQHLLEKELKSRPDIQAPPSLVKNTIDEFKDQTGFDDPQLFLNWLNQQTLTYKEFQEKIAFGLKIEQLKNQIVAPEKVQEKFEQRQTLLNRVLLSRIVLDNQDQAEQIKQQLEQDPRQFEMLARQHSITEDRLANGIMGPVRMGSLIEPLKTEIENAKIGDIIGPLEFDQRYCLFRVEEFLTATLEGSLKQEIQNQIFEEWLQQKLAKMQVKLEVPLQEITKA